MVIKWSTQKKIGRMTMKVRKIKIMKSMETRMKIKINKEEKEKGNVL